MQEFEAPNDEQEIGHVSNNDIIMTLQAIPRYILYQTSVGQVDHDSLSIRIRQQSLSATLPTEPTLLRSTKRGVEKRLANAVYSHHSTIKSAGNSQGSIDILGKDSGHQTILCVVRELDNFGLGLEGVDYRDRAEDLLAHDLGIVRYVFEDGWLDIVSLQI